MLTCSTNAPQLNRIKNQSKIFPEKFMRIFAGNNKTKIKNTKTILYTWLS